MIDIEAIEKLVTTTYMEAVHSSDPVQYTAMFTEDGMWMPPDSDPVSGRSALEDAERHIFSLLSLKIVSNVVDTGVSGNIGWALGEIDGSKIPHDGSEPTPFHFRVMWVVRKEGSEWKIHRQLWNSRPVDGADKYQL